MKIKQILEGKTTTVTPPKPRNFVAKNAIQSGAGAHKDKKKAQKQGDVKHKNKELAEGAEFGAYTYEKIAQRVFDDNPNLPTSGRGDEFFNAAFPYIVELLGSKKHANYMLNYDEDFPSDLISAYSHLQKQEQTEGVDNTIDSVKTAVSNAANKVGDTLANALPKDMRPFDNQTASNFTTNIASKQRTVAVKESKNPDTMSATDYDRYQQNQMDQEKRDFKSREMHHELDHEERGMYFVVIAKNGKWEYTKAQPRQEGMNAAQRIINSLHAKYPSMHLGMMGPDGKVYNYGKGK
jgi:hypothetical protein